MGAALGVFSTKNAYAIAPKYGHYTSLGPSLMMSTFKNFLSLKYERFTACAFNLGLLLSILVVLGCFPSCGILKRTKETKPFIYKQTVKGAAALNEDDVETLFAQKQLRKLFSLPIFPYVYFYQVGEKLFAKQHDKLALKKQEVQATYDELLAKQTFDGETHPEKYKRKIEKSRSKLKKIELVQQEGNWLMRSVGEAPVYFDSLKAKETVKNFISYARQHGYYSARCSYSVKKVAGVHVDVSYALELGEPHRIHEIFYDIDQRNIRELIFNAHEERFFNLGDIVDEDKMNQERDRIFLLMRNNGFFDFGKQYIRFEVDTNAHTLPEADIRIIIDPHPVLKHKQLRVKNVFFISDQVSRTDLPIFSEDRASLQLHHYKKKYSGKILQSRIQFHSDSLFSSKDANDTQRALAELNMFKFINIRYDTTATVLNATISTISYPKYDFAIEGGVNFTQLLPGPFLSIGLTNRNLMGGCEIFSLQLRSLVEVQGTLSDIGTQGVNTQAKEFSLQSSLNVPKFIFPLTKNFRKKVGRFNPQTRFQASYTYVDRPQYERLNLQSFIRYKWNNNKNTTYQLSLLELNLNITNDISEDFVAYLQDLAVRGNTLMLSFSSSMVSSSIFQFQYNSNLYSEKKRGTYVGFDIELGSSVISQTFIGGEIENLLNDSTDLPVFAYWKTGVDLRKFMPISDKKLVAAKFRFGLAKSSESGDKNGILPYEKYYFAGGSNSIRAWNPRRLGPGSYSPERDADGNFIYRYEQPGEMILEMSLEYRLKLFSFVNAGFFLDAGNIWMVNADSRQGSNFALDRFYKEIALGAGAGLRLDFSFLVMRTDIGLKVYDPAETLGNRWLLDEFGYKHPLGKKGQAVLNIAIGYPF